MQAKGIRKGWNDGDFRLFAAIIRNLDSRVVNWEAGGEPIGTDGINAKSAQRRWEALRRREDNILQGVVIHRSKTKHVQDGAAPGPKKPKKAPVPRAKRVKKESGAAEAQIVDPQNMKREIQQPSDDEGGQKEMVAVRDEGSVDGQCEDQGNPVEALLDGAAKTEDVDVESDSNGDVYA
jgi:hypothetical protein